MATKQEILSDIATFLADNTTQDISAQDVRDRLVDIVNLVETGSLKSYESASFVHNDQTGSFISSSSYIDNTLTLYSDNITYTYDLSGLAGGAGVLPGQTGSFISSSSFVGTNLILYSDNQTYNHDLSSLIPNISNLVSNTETGSFISSSSFIGTNLTLYSDDQNYVHDLSTLTPDTTNLVSNTETGSFISSSSYIGNNLTLYSDNQNYTHDLSNLTPNISNLVSNTETGSFISSSSFIGTNLTLYSDNQNYSHDLSSLGGVGGVLPDQTGSFISSSSYVGNTLTLYSDDQNYTHDLSNLTPNISNLVSNTETGSFISSSSFINDTLTLYSDDIIYSHDLSGISNYTFNNGLDESGSTVNWGGTLTSQVNITADDNNIVYTQLPVAYMWEGNENDGGQRLKYGYLDVTHYSSNNEYIRMQHVDNATWYSGGFIAVGSPSATGATNRITLSIPRSDNTGGQEFIVNIGNSTIFTTEVPAYKINHFRDHIYYQTITTGPGTQHTVPTDAFIMYSADGNGAGTNAPHFKTEDNKTITLYEQTAVTSPQGIADALTSIGLLASSTITEADTSNLISNTETGSFISSSSFIGTDLTLHSDDNTYIHDLSSLTPDISNLVGNDETGSFISSSSFIGTDLTLYSDNQNYTHDLSSLTTDTSNLISNTETGSFISSSSFISNTLTLYSDENTYTHDLSGLSGGSDTDWEELPGYMTASTDVQITGSLSVLFNSGGDSYGGITMPSGTLIFSSIQNITGDAGKTSSLSLPKTNVVLVNESRYLNIAPNRPLGNRITFNTVQGLTETSMSISCSGTHFIVSNGTAVRRELHLTGTRTVTLQLFNMDVSGTPSDYWVQVGGDDISDDN